jgi:long-chain acyl-CoA synthetase
MDVTGLTDLRAAPRIALDAAAATPDRVRFQVRRTDGGWTPVTWREFGRQIRAVAAGLIGRGIAPGDRVAVFGTNSVAWAAAALGAQAVGATMVPIYPASTGEAARYVLTHADCRAVFVATGQRPALAAAELPEIRAIGLDDGTWSDFLAGGEHADRADPSIVDARLAAVELDRPGLMLYTSGTSGPPKGVPLTHRNVGENGAAWLRANAPLLERGDRDVLWLPMSHIFGWGEMTNGNLLGWESWMCTPAEVMAVFPEVAPQVFMSVPAYWEKLVRAVDAAASSTELADRRAAFARITGGRLRFCLSGGAGLSRTIKDELLALGALVIEGYGLTETSPTLTLNRPDRYPLRLGRPAPRQRRVAAGRRRARSRPADPTSSPAITPTPTPPPARSPPMAGSAPATSAGSPTTASCRSSTARRTSWSPPAARTCHRPTSRLASSARRPSIGWWSTAMASRTWWAAVWLTADGDAAAAAAAVERVNRDLAKFETIKKFWIADEPLTIEAGLLTSSLKLRRKAVYQRYRDRFEALYG